jgi:hypothetical protein
MGLTAEADRSWPLGGEPGDRKAPFGDFTMIERRIKAAKFPAVKSLDSFDFKVIPRSSAAGCRV